MRRGKFYKVLAVSFLMTVTIIKTKGQTSEEILKDADIPGTFSFHIGQTIVTNKPDSMSIDQLGAWSAGIYYLYDFPIGQSKFSFAAGFGLGLDKYPFDQAVTLQTANDDSQTSLVPVSDVIDFAELKKTILKANYFEFPIEFRFHSNSTNKRKGISAAIGGKVGILYEAHTKIKYEDNSFTKKIKNSERFNLNSLKYSGHVTFGSSGFNLFYQYNISELFKNKEGPQETRASTMMAGFAFTGF